MLQIDSGMMQVKITDDYDYPTIISPLIAEISDYIYKKSCDFNLHENHRNL